MFRKCQLNRPSCSSGSVESSRIMKFTLKGTYVGGFDLGLHLPWGMVAFRDALGEALYVCLDEPFEANNYGTPNPAGNRGFVLRIYLDEDGAITPRPQHHTPCCLPEP